MRTIMTERDHYDLTMLDVSKQNFETILDSLKDLIAPEGNQFYLAYHPDGTRSITLDFFGLHIVFFEADPTGAEDDLFLMRKGATESPESESEEQEYAA